jgi:hypothetical protein
MFQKTISILLLLGFYFTKAQIKNDTITKQLQEVVVKNNPKKFSNKNGNIKIDVSNSVLSTSSNTLDLLSKLPNVQISSNKETISILGKGNPVIYLDNQNVGINDLNTLEVDDIKTIEIINNPSSKYEANGRVVILITRKFSKKEGFKVNVFENASFKKRFNNYLGLNSSIKKDKIEFKTNFSYNQLNMWESNGIETELTHTNFNSSYLATAITKRPQIIFGTGIFYQINNDDYLSVSFSGRFQKDIFDINTITNFIENGNQNNVITISDNNDKRNFLNSFLNYNKKIKQFDLLLFTGFQYSNFTQNTNNFIQNNLNKTQFEEAQKRNLDFNVTVICARTDIEKKFKNESQLEFGALHLNAKATTNQAVFNNETNQNLISNYDFNEQNSSVYTQYSGKIKKINYQIGVRAENTNVKGKFKNDTSFLVDKNYTSLFPKLQLEIPLDSTKTLSFNYAKSIARPNYSNTSQGSTYINPYFVFTRNINLNPTFADKISINLLQKNKSLELSMYKIKNPNYYSFSLDENSNIVTFMPTNFDSENRISLEFTLPFAYKIWSSTAVLSSTISEIKDRNAIDLKSKPWFYFYLDQTFQVTKSISIGINSWANTTINEGIFRRKSLFVNSLSISKEFSNNWNFTINWNDIFKKMNFEEKLNINNINTNAKYYTDTNEVSFSIKYSFGKIKNSIYKEKEIDENGSRIK